MMQLGIVRQRCPEAREIESSLDLLVARLSRRRSQGGCLNRQTTSSRSGRGSYREREKALNPGGHDPLMQTKRKLGYGVVPEPGDEQKTMWKE